MANSVDPDQIFNLSRYCLLRPTYPSSITGILQYLTNLKFQVLYLTFSPITGLIEYNPRNFTSKECG